MHESRRTTTLFTLSLLASILTHVLFIHAMGWFGRHDLIGPIMLSPAVMVDLTARPDIPPPPPTEACEPQEQQTEPVEKTASVSSGNERPQGTTGETEHTAEPASQPVLVPNSHPVAEPVLPPGIKGRNSAESSSPVAETHPNAPRATTIEISPPLRSAAEFLNAEQETLSYRITLLGLPVGSGELQAKQERGDIKITLRVTSSLVMASVYPVDDLIETRLLTGNYIITRIKQQEGSFRGDRGFTLFLREKSVFWIDLLKQTSTRETLPNSDVVDILSGLYYLRNRPLQVGKTETLHIFDSNIYTSVPVEVLRREKISLPGFKSADTLLLHPLIKTEGIFKRAGDILIWVTNDENHVPVRVETSIKLGKVTAELTASEVKRKEEEEKKE